MDVPGSAQNASLANTTYGVSDAIKPQPAPSVKTEFSFSPAADAEYMAAVESGDMETAQRLYERLGDEVTSGVAWEYLDQGYGAKQKPAKKSAPGEIFLAIMTFPYYNINNYNLSWMDADGQQEV